MNGVRQKHGVLEPWIAPRFPPCSVGGRSLRLPARLNGMRRKAEEDDTWPRDFLGERREPVELRARRVEWKSSVAPPRLPSATTRREHRTTADTNPVLPAPPGSRVERDVAAETGGGDRRRHAMNRLRRRPRAQRASQKLSFLRAYG